MAYLLREVAANGSVTDHALDSMSNVQVTEGSTYSLIDSETMQPVEAASLRRRGDDLELQVEGELVADVQGFYTEGVMASFSDGESVVSSTADQGEAGNAWQAAEIGGVHAGYYALGLGAIALATGGGSTAAQTILIAAAAGPFVTTMGVEIYGEDGTLLAELEHDFSTGPVPVDIDGDYTGALLVKVIDINGDAGDYLDEATGEIVSLGNQSIRAMATTENTEVSVTPLTELATVLAGVTEDNTITEEQVTTNDQVEELFGITDILGDVVTIVDEGFDSSDGTSDAEAYGQILAILSGADQVLAEEDETPETPITLTETIQQIADAITEASEGEEGLVLGEEAAALIIEGAEALVDGLEEQAAAAEEAGEEFDIVIDIEDAIPEEILEAAVDTTPPTTTISGIDISADNGSSAEDFVTNTAAQTITATLSATLEEGDVLMLSVDGGTTFTDVTSSVDGTAVSVAATLSAGSIQFRVDDAAGNQGAVATQAYTLDTSAPTISSVVVNTDSTVSITFSDDLANSELVPGDFSINVGDSSYSFTAVSIAGAVATLVPAENIYATDQVVSLVYSGEQGAVKDVAGNEVAPVTIDTVTNNSIGQKIELSKSVAELVASSNFAIEQTGGAGNDLLAVTATETVATSSSGSSSSSSSSVFSIAQDGGAGNDTIGVLVDINISSESNESVSAAVADVSVAQDGGEGSDSLSVELNAAATGGRFQTGSAPSSYTTKSAYAYVSYNDIEQQGGAGDDSLNIELYAIAQTNSGTADGYAYAYVSDNDISAVGGDGYDEVDILLSANAQPGGTYEYNTADATVEDNLIYASGEDVDIDLLASAVAYSDVSAYVKSNEIAVDVDSQANILLSANASMIGTDETAEAYVSENMVDVSGGNNNDAVVVSMLVDADAPEYYASAYVYDNMVDLEGNGGDDSLTVKLSADASGVHPGTESGLPIIYASGSAYVESNLLSAAGGDGNDQIVFDLDAHAIAETGAEAYISDNEIVGQGSAGNDQLTAALYATAIDLSEGADAYVDSNFLSLLGGDGVDTVDVDMRALAQLDGPTSESANASAYATENTVIASGEQVNINVTADADGRSHIYQFLTTPSTTPVTSTSTNYAHAYAYNYQNQVEVEGGSANDQLYVTLMANASALEASAGAYLGTSENYNGPGGNRVSVWGGDGEDTVGIVLQAHGAAQSHVTVYHQSNEVEASGENVDITLAAEALGGTYNNVGLSYNDVFVIADSQADVGLYATANGAEVGSAEVVMFGNDVSVLGGSGADVLNVVLSANAFSSSSEARAEVTDNFVQLDGGAGNDMLGVRASVNGDTANLFSNAFLLRGGEGSDTINLTLSAESVQNNLFLIRGGEGADTLNFDLTATGSSPSAFAGNYFSIYYGQTSHLGDSINGLEVGSDRLFFNFHADFFNGSNAGSFNLNSALTGSGASLASATTGQLYFYQNDSINDIYALHYDADGFGTGTADAQLVAQFDRDMGINAANLFMVGTAPTSRAVATLGSRNEFLQIGASETDNLGAYIYDTTSSGSAAVSYFSVTQFGDKGDDVLGASFLASATSSASQARVQVNRLNQEGGQGEDQIDFGFRAVVTSSSEADATVSLNYAEVNGDQGGDTIIGNFYAGLQYGGSGLVQQNRAEIDGDDGLDVLMLDMRAVAGSSSSGAAADAHVDSNFVGIYGGADNDVITASLGASALGSGNNQAGIYSNEIALYGDSGDDHVKAYVNATALNSGSNGGAEASYNTIEIRGGGGSDDITASLIAGASGIANVGAALLGNRLGVYGDDGGDTINVLYRADVTDGSIVFARIYYQSSNTVSAGDGDDVIDIDMSAIANGGYTARAGIYSNNSMYVDGDNGLDSIDIDVIADANAQSVFAEATVRENDFYIFAGDNTTGVEDLNILLQAEAETVAGITAGKAQASVFDNDVELYGDEGADSLTITLRADASGAAAAYANFSTGSGPAGFNDIYADGGQGSDVIDIDIIADASVSGSGNAQARAFVFHNEVEAYMGSSEEGEGFFGSSAATVSAEFGSVSLRATAVADGSTEAQALADVLLNNVELFGASGDDSLTVTLAAFASASSNEGGAYAEANVSDNEVYIHGQSGSDSLVLNLSATGVESSLAATSNNISENYARLSGGEGVDAISINIGGNFVSFGYNTFEIIGGSGSDVINYSDSRASGSSYNNQFYFDYYGAEDFGDSINGFASVFSSASTVALRFTGSDFTDDGSALYTASSQFGAGGSLAAADSNDLFFYDSSAFVLYYDADGFGAGASALAVASFDADVGLTASNITVGGLD